MNLNNLFKTEPAHIHEWDLVSKTYAAPRKEVNPQHVDAEVYQKALFGVTTLLWECQTCRAHNKEQLLGTDEETLDNLMDRVDEGGPQYVTRNGMTYMLGSLTPANNIPVR